MVAWYTWHDSVNHTPTVEELEELPRFTAELAIGLMQRLSLDPFLDAPDDYYEKVGDGVGTGSSSRHVGSFQGILMLCNLRTKNCTSTLFRRRYAGFPQRDESSCHLWKLQGYH